MDEYLFAPVAAGLWTHEQLVRGVFTLDDLMDAHEVLAVRAENARRHQEWLASKPAE